MRKAIRIRAVWMAIGLVLGGSAFATAAVTNDPQPAKGNGPKVEAQVQENDNDDGENGGVRQKNHGFYVSRAAHCKAVNDPKTDVSFEPPENCEGKAHGKYVSSVARSQAGKSFKD